MTYDVTIAGTTIVFQCDPEETVLDAAERAGFSIPYSCRKGVCSTCAGRLCAGELDVRGRGRSQGPADGLLLCQARPSSDVEIAPTRIIKREPSPRKTLLATVYRISRPASDVVVLRLRFPIGVRAKFRAGQYLKVLMDGNQSRDYSIANPPHESDGVELHIRRVPDGLFSDVVLAGLEKGGTVRVELPYGEFSLNETSMKPAILVATGTGLAPMQSMIEDQLRRGGGRSIHLYWGARRPQDLYLAQLPARWRRAPWLAFTPVVSEPDEEWTGRTGLVHRAVLDDHPDLREFEVYACGNPKMIASARRDFTVEGRLRLEEFYCDVFVASGDVAPLIASVL